MNSDTSRDNLRNKCPVEGCKAAFQRPSKLEVHLRKHTGERPFVCDEFGCSKAYTNHAHLKRHKCLAHDPPKPTSEFLCREKGCGLVLSNKYALKKHNQTHNRADYAFTCFECSQGFHKKRQLKRHIYLHTGEVPFKCIKCNIGFKDRFKYSSHLGNHKTFTCDCGEVFDRWTVFCAHRRTSCNIKKNHTCVICNKTFTTSTNLAQHSLVHVQESQTDVHRCPYIDCTRAYKYKKNLTYHMASFHEKLKDKHIKCTEPGCEVVFKTKKNFKQHLSNIHSNVPRVQKPRAPRKDKGKPKKCMASVLSGVSLPLKEHLLIINNGNMNGGNVSENKSDNGAVNMQINFVDEQSLSQSQSEETSDDELTCDSGMRTNNLANE